MYRYTIGNDHVYLIRNARSAVAPGTLIPTDAVGTLTVRELPADDGTPGAEVAGQTWPAVFAWNPALNGFAGSILGSLAVVDRGMYEITATLDGGPGLHWQEVEQMRAYE